MRTTIFTLIFLLTGMLSAQSLFTSDDFEAQVLAYAPERHQGVSDKSFDFGTMVLRETVRQTDNNPRAFNRADYFNVLSGLISLQESDADIRLAWQKFIASDGSCEYLTSASFKDGFLSKKIPDYLISAWAEAEATCVRNGKAGAKPRPAPETYAAENKLDATLLKQIAEIAKDDQRYRKGKYEPEKQTPLDRKNERLIDGLYARYGTYLGTSLVGEAYNSVMWAVIQHSRPETMERYLPVVHAAVQAGELDEAPLRMLIDRVQINRTGQQVFGSQAGVPLLPKAEQKRIEKLYGID
ncbi:hypothetical protein FUA23_12100 [Neolewinella aurantiaca]|uniref:Uncharacterized protein n=1 Tax=Neolewinella aurantiaca TaxID=2602767 RepID=A0A5C7FH02_9BACT|nr:hypothetical protein [Neolewinella aurantiaca]TXF89023.1 hypothetical protein FUA23_12100 [Neolewinella aurantiaca]